MNRLFLSSLASLCLLPALSHAKVEFEKEVWPLLDRSCVSCHRAPYEENGRVKKPKAGLRFDGAWAIMAGSENGKVLTPGQPDQSEMLSRTMLPEDDDDFMPPKGEPWTEAEKKIVAQWITEGADFGGWEGNLEGKPVETSPSQKSRISWIQEHYEKLSAGVSPASEAAIQQVGDQGGRVTPLAQGSPLLEVDFLAERDTTTDDKVAALGVILEQLTHLDLSRTAITDAALAEVAEAPRLSRIDLHSTAVTDAGLQHLTGLENLVYLNLYDTQVTDAGIAAIARIKTLRNVYLWKSAVTEKGARELEKQLPEADINWK